VGGDAERTGRLIVPHVYANHLALDQAVYDLSGRDCQQTGAGADIGGSKW
jgi:hypothetical protein